ncbi:carbohydrate-binding domain-containing protein [Leucobacter luti]|uniref:Uncharacterized protein DUF4353 n=1 Tax=Leucobacter luti TaxID=340320 RepID=A0A4Q7U139_9MICO|nr:carbohydrate-binding domain-containing protein [Leucobacter luti]MBL3699563.1 carbohydrate-binding domain-containing protein [Leucobacter luti]RZT67075.1 uncharacterized protein DUF4353 [Leucobacter luti]
MKRQVLPFIAIALSGALLTGCAATSQAGATAAAPDATTTASLSAFTGDLSPDEVLAANADYTTVNPDEWDEADAVDVKLSGTGATSDAAAVSSAGGVVTISAAGVYRLSGQLDGQIVVAAPDDALVVLILDGATIASTAGAGIDVQTADDVAIALAAGSSNTVSDAASYAEDAEANAAIYADTDLTISGEGALTVRGNGNDGITSKDDLVVLSGAVTVTAADHAVRGKDALVVEGGTLTLTATSGDGLKSDQDDDETRGYILVSGGTIDITAGDDGVQAQTDTVITGGELTVDAVDDGVKGESVLSVGGGTVTVTASTEAMEAANIGLFGGTIDLTASDDGINASGNAATTGDGAADGAGTAQPDPAAQPSGAGAQSAPSAPDGPGGAGGPGGGMGGGGMADTGERLEISGGTITVDAEGDGLDSNGSLLVTGGDVTVYGPTTGGNGALDSNGGITVTGGTIVAFGAGDMEETPGSDSTQGWAMVSAQIAAGQRVTLADADGAEVVTATARKTAGSVVLVAPEIIAGDTYTLSSDGQDLGTATAGEAAAGQMGGGGGFPPAG